MRGKSQAGRDNRQARAEGGVGAATGGQLLERDTNSLTPCLDKLLRFCCVMTSPLGADHWQSHLLFVSTIYTFCVRSGLFPLLFLSHANPRCCLSKVQNQGLDLAAWATEQAARGRGRCHNFSCSPISARGSVHMRNW